MFPSQPDRNDAVLSIPSLYSAPALPTSGVLLWSAGDLKDSGTEYSDLEIGAGADFDSVTVLSGGTAVRLILFQGGTMSVADPSGIVQSIEVASGTYSGGGICSGVSGWYGPAICGTDGLITISSGTFLNNAAETLNNYAGQGGAVEAWQGTVTISDSLFEGNRAPDGGGGAILLLSGSGHAITGTDFNSNFATYGGAVQITYGDLAVSGGTFRGNSAGDGGALEVHQGGSAWISGATFLNNSGKRGGAIQCDEYYGAVASLTVIGGIFSGNSGDSGGAIYNTGSASLSGATFSDNSAQYGGAIQNSSILNIADATFSGNTAGENGGAISNAGTVNILGAVILSTKKDTIYNGGTMNWDISSGKAYLSDYSLLFNTPESTIAITVSPQQQEGIYILAGNASGIDDTFDVQTTAGDVLGTLSVGETKTFGDADYTLSLTGNNLALTIGELPAAKPAKSDVDGNNISEIVFQYTGGNYQIGFWMNGTNTWQSQGGSQPQDWELIGAYDMDQDGKADIVMRGNIQIGSDKGAYIGYYVDGDVTNWQNISYLNNPNDIDWRLAIGNITGNEGCNSLVWYSPELGALGVWTDGTDNWVSLGSGYDYSWTLEGCGDFDGDGKDDILFCHDGNLYCTDIDNNFRSLGGWGTDWKVCTTGDFSGDGKDDIILQNGNMVVKFEDGLAENWESIGVMDATDWFIVGAGDYNGDQEEDLLVRQYSTGMLGYYESGDMNKWVEVGRGVDMNWTVIA